MLRKSFPVAIKPSNPRTQLVSILLESEIVPNAAYVKLQNKKTRRKRNFFKNFTPAWNFLLHSTIFLNYLITNYILFVSKTTFETNVLGCMQVVSDVIFGMDILKNLITKNFVIFFLDLFLLLPFSTFYDLAHKEFDQTYVILKMLTNIRIYKIFWKIFKNRNSIGVNQKFKTFTIFMVFLIIGVNSFACLWFLIMCPFGQKKCAPEILDRFFLDSRKSTSWCSFATIIYYVWMTIFGYGHPFINLYPSEATIMGLTSWYGLLLLAFLCGNLLVIEVMSRERNHKLEMQLEKTLELCEGIEIDKEFMTSLKNHHQDLLRFKLGAKNNPELLPEGLVKEICFDQNYPALGKSLMFKDFPVVYLGQVAEVMRHEFFAEGASIYTQGEVKDKMVVVVNGVLEVMSSDDESRGILDLGPGTCLGEASLVLRIISKATVKAKSYVELQVLYRDGYFLRVMPKFKNEHKILLNSIKKRCKNQLKAKTSFFKKIKIGAKNDKILELYKTHNETESHPYLLNQNSKPKYFWDFFIALTSLYIAIFYPYFAIFGNFPDFLTQFTDLILVIDAVINLITKKYKKTDATDNFDTKTIIFKNLHENQMLLDIIAAFYFENLTHAFINGHKFYKIAKLNRVLKFYKFLIFFKNYKILPALLAYWLGITAYALTCFDNFCRDNGWFKIKMTLEIMNNTQEPIFAQRFLFSQFFILSFLKGFELHELTLVDPRDMIITAVAVILGYLLFIIFTIKLTITNLLKLRNLRKYQLKLLDLRTICDRFDLNERLRRRLFNYFQLQWRTKHFYDIKFRSNIPIKLEEEISLKENLDVLKSVEFFANFSDDFLKDLAKRAKMYVIPAFDILTYHGSVNKEIFIIKEGVCVYKFYGGSYKKMKTSTTIGLCSLFFNIPESITVRTITPCKLLSVDGFELQATLNLHPEVNGFIKKLYKEVVYKTYHKEFSEMPSFHQLNDVKNQKVVKIVEFLKTAWFVNVYKLCVAQDVDYFSIFKAQCWTKFLKFLLVPITILPDGLFLLSYQIFQAIIGFTYVIVTPLNLIVDPVNVKFWNLFLDIFVYLDLFVSLHVGFYLSNGVLVVHPLKTAENYLHNGFILDLIFAAPYEVFYAVILGEIDEYYLYVRLIKVAQVYRLIQAIYVLEKYVERHTIYVQIFKFLTGAVLIINFFACLEINGSCDNIGDNIMSCDNQSWIGRSKYWKYNGLRNIYPIAAYHTTNLMLGLSFGDIEVQGGKNLGLSICIMIAGAIFLSYSFTSIVPHLIISDFKTMKYKKQLIILKNFMKNERINKELAAKIETQLIYDWRRSKNIPINKLLSSLHTNLLQDTLSFLYEETLKQVPLFKEIERSFLRIFSMIIKPETFLKNQIIVKKNDILEYFYIIHEGKVHIELLQSNLELDLVRGSIFGYFYDESLPVMTITAKASTNVEVLCVQTYDYFNILRNHPRFHSKVQNIISEYKDFMSSTDNFKDAIVVSSIFARKNEAYVINARKKFKLSLNFFFHTDLFFAVLCWWSSLVAFAQFMLQLETFMYQNILCDVLLILRLVIMCCFKPFYDKNGNLVVERDLIRRRYFREAWNVVPDLLILIITAAAYLLYQVVLGLPNRLYVYTLMYLINIYRLVYTVKFYMEEQEELMNNHCLLKMLWMIKWIILWMHYSACIWAHLVCPFATCDDYKDEKFALYKRSLFLMSNIFTSLGTTDTLLQDWKQFFFIISFELISKLLWIVLIGSVINILYLDLKMSLKYHRNFMELKDYLKCSNVHRYIIKKCLNYLKILWNSRSGEKVSFLLSYTKGFTSIPTLVNKLPESLQQELKSSLYKPVLSNCYIFMDTEALFLEKLGTLLDFQIYFPGNVIVHDGKIDNCMYFIKKGEVEILSLNLDLTEKIHDVLFETEMFGVGQGLFRNMPHQFTFRAGTVVEVLSLQLEKWEHLLAFYKKSSEIIYKRVKNMHLQLSDSI